MTDFKTILVHLNHESRVPYLIAAAASLARPTKAHVIGLYVMPPIIVPADVIFPMGSFDMVEPQIEMHRAQAERIRAIFENSTKGEPFVSEWRKLDYVDSAIVTIADGVVEEAHAVDLVIASQAQSDIRASGISDVAERVALESGRPVLVIPESWDTKAYGTHVAVAWNGRREATRATFDSMPILRQAEVRLLTVVSDEEFGRANTLPGGEIAATLARHGLNVEVQTIDRYGNDTGDALLSHVASDGANLLVMGAYGHSRFKEFILGGVTRHVLKHMTVPVLMSH